ncbi:MAG: APC family permease [Treponemataceae bacterium]
MQKNKLGLTSATAMIVGGMIGSAIFSLSGLTIYYAGPSALISWILAAFILFLYGMQVAELSSIFPKSGGVFVFPAKSLGKTDQEGQFWGLISTWGYINANIGGIAFAAIYVARYLGAGFPQFAHLQIPLAIAACVFCGILNLLKITLTGKANIVLVIALISTLLCFIILGLTSQSWNANHFLPFFSQGIKGLTGSIIAIPNAMVAYGSIVTIAFMVNEVHEPKKNVPRSMVISILIVLTLYLLVITTILGLITTQFLIEKPQFRFIPLYAAAFTSLQSIPYLAKIISISAIFALLTTILVITALTSRAISAASENKMLPAIFQTKSKNGSPIFATFFVVTIATLIASFPSLTEQIVNLASLFAAVTICINCISLIFAREKNPTVQEGFKVPFGNVIPLLTIFIIICAYIPNILSGGLYLIGYTLAWYILGIIFYKLIKK